MFKLYPRKYSKSFYSFMDSGTLKFRIKQFDKGQQFYRKNKQWVLIPW